MIAIVALAWLVDHWLLATSYSSLVDEGRISERITDLKTYTSIEKKLGELPFIEAERIKIQHARLIVVYQVLKCWRIWRQNGPRSNELLRYAGTALRMLGVKSVEELRSKHFQVVQGIELQIDQEEERSFDRFLKKAIAP